MLSGAPVADGGLAGTDAVMAFAEGATPVGLRGRAGSVWGWTVSRWGRAWQSLEYHYPYAATDGREDLQGRFARVMRGGSWFDRWQESRATKRGRFLPGSRASNIGFRLAADGGPVR